MLNIVIARAWHNSPCSLINFCLWSTPYDKRRRTFSLIKWSQHSLIMLRTWIWIRCILLISTTYCIFLTFNCSLGNSIIARAWIRIEISKWGSLTWTKNSSWITPLGERTCSNCIMIRTWHILRTSLNSFPLRCAYLHIWCTPQSHIKLRCIVSSRPRSIKSYLGRGIRSSRTHSNIFAFFTCNSIWIVRSWPRKQLSICIIKIILFS